MLDRRAWLMAGGVLAAAATSRPAGAAPAASAARPAPLKIGQIGVGHAHASKLSVYRASSDYQVVGLVEPDPELRRWAASQAVYRDVPWMSAEQLLNTPGLSAVLVETRVRDLLAVAAQCIAAGKHIHLDKPAGESLPAFRRLLDEASRQGLLVQLGYMYRYNPGVKLLRELLTQGWLGDVFEVEAVMSKVVAPAARRELAEYPGGMMFELGCHLIDLVVGVLGKPVEVLPVAHHSGSQDDSLMDNMLAVFRYPRASATVRSSGLEVEGFRRRHLTVCGTEGTLHIQPLDNPTAHLALSQPRGTYRRGYQELELPKYTRYVDDAADMARVIRGEKASDFPPAHDLAVQETLLQAAKLPVD